MVTRVRHRRVQGSQVLHRHRLIADSSPDITHKDQMAILLRYIAIDRDKRSVLVQERSTGYFQLVDGTALGVCSGIERDSRRRGAFYCTMI